MIGLGGVLQEKHDITFSLQHGKSQPRAQVLPLQQGASEGKTLGTRLGKKPAKQLNSRAILNKIVSLFLL